MTDVLPSTSVESATVDRCLSRDLRSILEERFWRQVEEVSTLEAVSGDGWVISTPVDVNIPGGSVSRLYRQYDHIGPHQHLEIIEVDATDFIATLRAMDQAVAYLRVRAIKPGPAAVEAEAASDRLAGKEPVKVEDAITVEAEK